LAQREVGGTRTTAYEEVSWNVLKMMSYEKMPNMKVVRIVEKYNFAFGVI
jgi:hypothetical protein